MKKGVKITLIVLAVIVFILIIGGLWGWIYFKNTFVDFEGDYAERTDIPELTIDGYTFLDRNGNGELDIYEDGRRPIGERVEDLISQMTIEEKIHLLKGSGLTSAMGQNDEGQGIPGAAGTIVPTPRLGLPTVYLSDGPAGLRIEPTREGEDRTYYATAFPIATLLASSWNTELVQEVGTAMGNEALTYGVDVILGPGANIHRHPLCGRNFEYYSEDPLLTGYMGAAMVNGIESNGVGTSVKHFVANNQETNRNNNDAIVSDRAMREIYLKGFEIIVKEAQPWTIMSSYNKVNGTYVAESHELLTDVLRDEWGFEGIVMSDWFGGSDAVAMVQAGNDLLEPGTKKQWKALTKGYKDGELTEEVIDTSVRRILKLVLGSMKMKDYDYNNNPDLEAHARVTRRSAAEGMVLLKNEMTLPIGKDKQVALLGVTSFDMYTGGTGSGDVNEAYIVSLEEGLSNAGYSINPASKDIFEAHKAANAEAFDRPEGLSAMMNPYIPPQIDYTQEQLEEIAGSSDVAILTIGRNSGEGYDRVVANDFSLSSQEMKMITDVTEAFHAQGKKVIVVMNIGGVIETASWKRMPDAILLAWQGGQENGNSIADVLSGAVNPSGRLPMTFPVNIEDHASHANFPLDGKQMSMMDFISGSGKKVPEDQQIANEDYTKYEEGIYVGYRHFDKAGLEVSYPFGYGLSYTEFALDSMTVRVENESIIAAVRVTNTGDVAGKEVVQLYVAAPGSSVDRPKQELKGFAKTGELAAGESQTVEIRIPVSELRYWDESSSAWKLESGTYSFNAGVSSRDIRVRGEMEI